eukprot:scaffold4943_cov66-Phaeocystis_antarctica.AAC.2
MAGTRSQRMFAVLFAVLPPAATQYGCRVLGASIQTPKNGYASQRVCNKHLTNTKDRNLPKPARPLQRPRPLPPPRCSRARLPRAPATTAAPAATARGFARSKTGSKKELSWRASCGSSGSSRRGVVEWA